MENESGLFQEEEYLEDQLERALDQAEYERESEREERLINSVENLK